MITLIDTHTHIDAPSFDVDRSALVAEAKEAGLVDALICSGIPGTFEKTRAVAHEIGWHYALGVHPLYIEKVSDVEAFLFSFAKTIEDSLEDPLFAGVGEIGLDGFVPGLDRKKMLSIFRGQLKIAKRFELPVSVHARHAVDVVSREIARIRQTGGVIHAFNGSVEQAKRLLGLKMKLGFGGALTYEGSRRIRKAFVSLNDTDFVLETDAPDMPSATRRLARDTRTHPTDIFKTLEVASTLRRKEEESLAKLTKENALTAFPRLKMRLP